jgi:hypothetical protein
MKYMLMIYGNDEIWNTMSPDFDQVVRETDAFNRRYAETGELLGAYGVLDQSEAKTIRVRDGVPAVTDGPYIEAKEFLGSFSILDCESLERALEIAADYPGARLHAVELRPLMNESGSEM